MLFSTLLAGQPDVEEGLVQVGRTQGREGGVGARKQARKLASSGA